MYMHSILCVNKGVAIVGKIISKRYLISVLEVLQEELILWLKFFINISV